MTTFSVNPNMNKRKSKQEARFMRQRRQDRIQANFVANLMPNLQYYYRGYLDQDLFDDKPYLFSKLPLTKEEFHYFIGTISQSSYHDSVINIHNLHMIDNAFSGASGYATRRITLPILKKLCGILGVPIEAALFGTLDTKEIARYNYTYYGSLPPIIHLYLSRRIRRSNNFAYLLKQKPFCDYSARKLGKMLGVSRTVAGYLKTPDAQKKSKHCSIGLPNSKEQLTRYAEALHVEPEKIIEVPVIFFESYRDKDV